MGPDLELKGRLGSMASFDSKENEKSPGEPVAENITCISNYQDDIMKSEASMHKQAEQVDDSEVNITDTTSQDETENSSSFGNTLSGDEEVETLSDSEVMSKLRDNGFDQECRMRKKSLTAHWKTFIQPCMWRCRWAELRIRRLLYQASKYDLQAEAISRRKQLTLTNSTVEGSCARSLPFSGSNRKKTLIKRRKRKRVEDSTDTAAYMAQHPLFSYSGSKKFDADVVASLNNSANRGIPTNNRIEGDFVFGCGDEPESPEFRTDDKSLEQILWKIGVLQSHLGELKTRFKKVHDENAKDIYSADSMDTNDVPTSPAQNDVSTNEREKLVQVSGVASQLMPKCCDMNKNGTAISTHEEATELMDIIEFNDKLQIGISCEKEGNGHLMYSSPAKELNSCEKVEDQPTEKPETLEEEEQANIVLSVPVPLISISDDQPTEKPETLEDEEQANIVPSVPVPVISISNDQPEKPKEEHANIVLSVPVPVSSISDDQPEKPKEEQANIVPSVPVPVIPISNDQPEKPKEEQANIVPSVPVPVISIADDQPEKPKEEQANIVPSVPVPVISISDDQSKKRKEEQANMNPSSPVPVVSIADDQPTPKKRSISGLTSSPHNTRSRGRGRGRGRRRGNRWSRRA